MSTSARLTIAAAIAVALATAALVPVFDGVGWLWRVLGAIATVAVAGELSRRVGLPRLLQPVAGMLGLGAYVCLVFARPTLAWGLLPGGETLRVLGETIGVGLLEVEALAPPVPTTTGLVLLAALGVGGIAVLVDALGVTMRQPAIAGLPLLLLFAVPAAVLQDGLGWWPFALGAAGWLGLLLVDGSDAVSRWGTPLRAGSGRVTPKVDPALGRVGRRIGAAALGVAVVVPALLPGLDNRLLGGGSGGGGLGGSRTTTTYNPITELAGQLRLPEPGRLLLRYTSDDPEPDYLRMTTLSLYDEARGWKAADLTGDPQDDRVQDGIPTPTGTSSAASSAVRTRIDVANLAGPWLPTPSTASDVDVSGLWLWDEQSQTVFSTRTAVQDLDEPYTVESRRIQPTVEQLRRADGVPSGISEVYAAPPVLTPKVTQLVADTVRGARTDYDKVAAIQALFRDGSNGFTYAHDTSVPGFDSPDALERFLDGKRGFCEQYSSAMAAMVRSLGIPARVAVGFTTGTRQEDGSYRVTTSDAHAWPEVWFAGAGWVRFEPTPRLSQVSTPDYTRAPAEDSEPETPSTTPSTAPQATASTAPSDPGALDRGDDLTPAAGGAAGGGGRGPLLTALLVAAAAAAVLSLPALLATARRRRRWSRPSPLAAWEQVCDDAVDTGHVWRPADSPRAAAGHLAQLRALPDAAAAALHRLAVGAERARYARPGADSSADGVALRDDTRLLRRALLDTGTPGQRWLARLAPASTLRWASARLGAGIADLLDRFDSVVSAVGERVRHPGSLRRRPAA